MGVEAPENRERRTLTKARCGRCGGQFAEERTSAGVIFLICDCFNDEYFDHLYGVTNRELWKQDTNFRCTPTSPGILSQLLNGKMTAKSFFELVQAGSEFHFYRYGDGRVSYYESHVDSVAYGLERHAELT